jgi:hypothetical protein
MNCRHCGPGNDDQASFCEGCGQSLAPPPPRACPTCGAVNSDTARFCIGCGAALEAAASPTPAMEVKPDPGPPLPIPPPLIPPPQPPPRGGHKIAAICIWIVALFLVLIVLNTGVPSEEVRACIFTGGSGQQCHTHTGTQLVFGLLAFFAVGLGWRYWRK